MGRKSRRSCGKIDRLPDELRETVNQMLLAGRYYQEIVEYLRDHEVTLSQMAVCRYAQRYMTTVRELQMSQENMKYIMEEIGKYPGLDFSEAILRVAGQNLFTALTSLPEEAWEGMDPQKLIKEAGGLVRAAGYKKRVEQQMRSDSEKAIQASQSLLADVLQKSHPELYTKVMEALRLEQKKLKEAQG